eukprot:CAMPEP_0176248146 /NCGR_PEP_ID=MMETSP0121_2-20121125/33318_1 /TAXON_ID=160619 /ORGANISM="Kryptoperidinium foliaceum, Strain CCMP 1326" /LENGTH=69 /DNA_ID=CAMNT_0017587819 /DNA_START=100 /DNA_END=306 /DNA_ORIENTATION=+
MAVAASPPRGDLRRAFARSSLRSDKRVPLLALHRGHVYSSGPGAPAVANHMARMPPTRSRKSATNGDPQ